MEEVLVSIVCNTHNDEKYIETAIKSFLMQETTFKFEILIHDDASGDNTTNIIKKYEKCYPELIFPIYQNENKYSKYEDITLNYQTSRAKGKYIALCQGDDFWVDKSKLQKQFNILENHPEYKACANGAVCLGANDLIFKYFIAPSYKNDILNVKDVILGDGGYLATNSLFLRKEVYKNINKYGTPSHIDDYQLQLEASYPNGIYYLNDLMSVYRFNADDSWSTDLRKTSQKELLDSKIKILETFNSLTDNKYSKYIEEKKKIDFGHDYKYKLIKNFKYHFINKYYLKKLDNVYSFIKEKDFK